MKEKLLSIKPILALQSAIIVCICAILPTIFLSARNSIPHYPDPQSTFPLLSTKTSTDVTDSTLRDSSTTDSPSQDHPLDNPNGSSSDTKTDTNKDDLPNSGANNDTNKKEPYQFKYDLIIKAVHSGYKDPTTNTLNVGERIELQNLSDAPLSLAGIVLRYHINSTKHVDLITFSEGSMMTGEYLLFRYENSPHSEQSDLVYSAYSLPQSGGPLELIYVNDEGEEIIMDSVCWSGGACPNKKFDTGDDRLLVRNFGDGLFTKELAYDTHYDPSITTLVMPVSPAPDPDDDPTHPDDPGLKDESSTEDSTDQDSPSVDSVLPKCYALEFSEVYAYYFNSPEEQFIELYNPSNAPVDLDGCQIQYKKKFYPLSGVILPDNYYIYYPSGSFTLTKNPSSSNSIYLIDTDQTIADELNYPNGQKKSTSYARFFNESGSTIWRQTYAPTPDAENVYQEFRTCESGKVINPLTGNCVKSTTISTSSSTTLAECPAGQYRNPLTGRCKKLTTATSTPKECAEGYERNPETNRCRKITKENEGTDYALIPSTRSNDTIFIAFGIVTLLVSLGSIYVILQFRHEIARAARKTRQRLHSVCKNLFARKIGRHRNK